MKKICLFILINIYLFFQIKNKLIIIKIFRYNESIIENIKNLLLNKQLIEIGELICSKYLLSY